VTGPAAGTAGVELVEARRGVYADSVTLLQVSRQVAAATGVRAALVAMATELNLDLARGMGFTIPDATGPNDLLVAVRAEDEATLAAAAETLQAALSPPPTAGAAGPADAAPTSTGSALRRAPADLVLVSVPGPSAFPEAVDALDAGSDLMIFSDNVPVAQEIALKRRARAEGRLVMGPDCGTAVVGGIGLGFANAVRPGSVGLVAASGTGAQQLMSLLDDAGVGISACLGVGGRDLSAAVGGLGTLSALDLLDADPATDLIVVVSKPPADEVAGRVRQHATGLRTPVVLGLLGDADADLTALATDVVRRLGRAVPEWPRWSPPSPPPARAGALRGLYAGGTLCDEAMILAAAVLGPVLSNIPLRPDWRLDPALRSSGHLMIDFGDDELTRGRPHPMIDGSLRAERLHAEATDPTASVVLLDVVLGYGAAADPAAELGPAIAAATAAGLRVLVALIGTAGDPQDRDAQARELVAAGAAVRASNAEAARAAVSLVSGAGQ
jgi:FdrA protein